MSEHIEEVTPLLEIEEDDEAVLLLGEVEVELTIEQDQAYNRW